MDMQDERWNESNPELVRVIRDEIERDGPIRFDRFMELALYHDPHGYYRSAQPRPGRSGDFLTAPEAHPIFGATLAAQIADFDALLGSPSPFTLVEYGAGSGLLVRPLLAELRQQHPDLYERIRYQPFELNQERLTELREHLEAGGHAKRLALDDDTQPITGCILANEFLDAFPARRITRHDGVLQEALVKWRDDWFVEELRPVRDPKISRYLERHSLKIEEDEWLEFQPEIGGWVDEAANRLERGFVLIVDYGYPAGELFSGHRREGTLRAYYRHGVSTEYYRGVGEQDLTAHVNLSEVMKQAGMRGMSTLGVTTQADFLAALGIGERLVRLQQESNLTADDYLAIRSAVLRMIDPGAMGRFRVLMLGRGIAADRPPIGLRSPADQPEPGADSAGGQ